jgi:hypothetical protein
VNERTKGTSVICKSALAWIAAIVFVLACGQARADWLASQTQSNGSYSTPNDLATPTQATAEAVRTLRLLTRGAEVSAADAYLVAESYHGTEYLARKLGANLICIGFPGLGSAAGQDFAQR